MKREKIVHIGARFGTNGDAGVKFRLVPAIVLIVASFALIVVLMRIKLPLYAALIGACAFIAVAARVAGAEIARALGVTLTDSEVVSLCIIIALILLFSDALNLGGRLTRIVDAFTALNPGARLRLIAFPALIGLLPMPGGAVFSAPMVAAAGRGMKNSPGFFSAVNYWFRHVWEYWWPLYPGVLLAIALSKIPMGTYTVAMMPFTIVSLAAGVLVILRGYGRGGAKRAGANELNGVDAALGNNDSVNGRLNGGDKPNGKSAINGRSIRTLFGELSPILIVVIGGVGLELVREILEGAGVAIPQPLSRTAIIVALVAAIIYTLARDTVPMRKLFRDWVSKTNIEMVAMIVLVVLYKNLLDSAGAINGTVDELMTWHVPLWGVITILPFLLGLITGIQFAAVGVSFPVVLGMAEKAGIPVLAVASYAYVMAYMGTMLSPVHFCLLLTKEYFKDGFGVIYARIAIPVAALIVTAVALAWLYARIG